ncbi:hypothetical protein TEA_029106 [Camellia sinensis var. sinensis]|uniref:NADP-dependent oxidoreductase domain-containing protein n=1 Tax=Camellia sinensis var. sinensis TaxID=542762 RepID=A0A4S4DT83_CAMSN|nr:hypothetical protein TEA_029106 [Camellia sinensis var. sinensis]
MGIDDPGTSRFVHGFLQLGSSAAVAVFLFLVGARGTLWGTNQVMDCEILKEIAEAKGKTVAQVCLRWVYEQGVSVLVKSFNKERMKENLDIFDWTLSPEESKKIDQIPQQKGCPGLEFTSDQGLYKSVEELWDGKI